MCRSNADHASILLLAIQPQPTLFGCASVIRNWGRNGTNGQSMVEPFDASEEAKIAMAKLQQTKRQRGYSD